MVHDYFCNRCQKTFVGEECCGVTCGFYDVMQKPWSDFANKDEKVVCDSCMHKDTRYIAVYGKRQ